MSDVQKLKDTVEQFVKTRKELAEKVKAAAIEANRTRQERAELSSHPS